MDEARFHVHVMAVNCEFGWSLIITVPFLHLIDISLLPLDVLFFIASFYVKALLHVVKHNTASSFVIQA